MLNPEAWDDGNDACYLQLYREKKNLGSVLALCFAQASETYHHWRVFASGAGGVCISFKRTPLFHALKAQAGIRMGDVRYLTLEEIKTKTMTVAELPFLKRFPFQDEDEYRAIYESASRVSSFDIAIPLASIERITLSPWVHPALVPYMKETVKSIDGCDKLKVSASTLIGNEKWKAFGETAT
jgi:hypothetical protein